MKVLITGGTGSVGKILVPMLLDKNYDLTLTTRNEQKAISKNSRWADKVKFIETDYREDGSSNAADIENTLLDRGFVVSKVINQSVSNRFSPASEALTTSLLDLMVYGLEGRPLDQSWLIAKPSN